MIHKPSGRSVTDSDHGSDVTPLPTELHWVCQGELPRYLHRERPSHRQLSESIGSTHTMPNISRVFVPVSSIRVTCISSAVYCYELSKPGVRVKKGCINQNETGVFVTPTNTIYVTYELRLMFSSRYLVMPHYRRETNMCDSLHLYPFSNFSSW